MVSWHATIERITGSLFGVLNSFFFSRGIVAVIVVAVLRLTLWWHIRCIALWCVLMKFHLKLLILSSKQHVDYMRWNTIWNTNPINSRSLRNEWFDGGLYLQMTHLHTSSYMYRFGTFKLRCKCSHFPSPGVIFHKKANHLLVVFESV